MAKQPVNKTKNNPPAAAKTAEKTTEKSELDELDSLGEEEGEEGGESTTKPAEEEEAEPEVFTEKDLEKAKKVKEKKVEPKVLPRENFVLDKKGEKRLDEDKEPMRYAPGHHRQVGFVNENRVLFPVGFRFKGGFVGSFGNVIVSKCPSCGFVPSVDDSRQGRCPNPRAGAEKIPCDFDQIALLNEVTLEDLE